MSKKFLLGALTGLLVLCGAVLAVIVFRPGETAPVPPPSAATAATPPLGQFTPLNPSRPAPALAFTLRGGSATRLAAFHGKTVLLNLWATWCGPCVEEMPSLDRLQQQLGTRLTILAVSEDQRGAAAVDPFLAQHGIKNLTIGLDPDNAAMSAFHLQGLPTSFLIGADGKIQGQLVGAAKWDTPAMIALLDHYLPAK